MMTSMMDSRAFLKIDSKSMSDPESDSDWLHLFTRTDVKATTRRVPVRLGDMAQCWEKNGDDSGQEEDEDNEQEEIGPDGTLAVACDAAGDPSNDCCSHQRLFRTFLRVSRCVQANDRPHTCTNYCSQ